MMKVKRHTCITHAEYVGHSSAMEDESSETTAAKEEVNGVENQPDHAATSSGDHMEEPEEEDSSEEEEEVEGSEDEDGLDREIYEKDTPAHPHLKADVKEAARRWNELEQELGIESVQIEPSVSGHPDTCTVVLTLNVSTMTDELRSLWELGTAITVSVIVEGVSKDDFRAFDKHPSVLSRIDADKQSKFPVGESLINLAKATIADSFKLEKNLPPAEVGSFFSMLYERMLERMKTLTEYCMVCGNKLYAGGLLLSICDGALCQYQYQELGLMEGLTTPRVSAPVLSLLMMTFHAAVSSERWEDILTPAPSARDIDQLVKEAKLLYDQNNLEWEDSKDPTDFDVYMALTRAMPCAHDILASASNYSKFKQNWPSVAELVEWLVISNHSYLELVPPKLNVDFLHTADQFLFVADTPSKQAEFDALVQKHGGRTRYLFHGSDMENWHSIIRSGLKNMSGTKYQTTGAIHGNGIYLSNYLPTSSNYCSEFTKEDISEGCVTAGCCFPKLIVGGMILLAVVEVVDTPEAFSYEKNKIVVVPDEKWCSIRMLVAYGDDVLPDIDLNDIKENYRQKIQNVVHMFKTASLEERVEHAPKATDAVASASAFDLRFDESAYAPLNVALTTRP